MRRRFFALGYVFFILLTGTGLIMVFAFIERISTQPTLTTSDLIEEALSDTASINKDLAYVVENIGNDLHAALKNFHYYPEVDFIDAEHRSNCLSCHSPLPHNKEIKQRAFLNMHGGYVSCQACHGGQEPVDYMWYDVERNVLARALPENREVMSVLLVAVKDGEVHFEKETDQTFIAQYTPTIQADPDLKDQLCETSYRNTLEYTLTCDECHTSKNARVDWNQLGYSEKRALELATLSTPSVYQKYDEFYIPSF